MTTPFIDTHAHLACEELLGELDAVLARARESNVLAIICVATEPAEWPRALELTRRAPGVLAACGVHPHQSDQATGVEGLTEYLRYRKVVAVGETGLDYHYDFSPRADQWKLFEQHVELARAHRMPVIVHCREAFDDALSVLRAAGGPVAGVFHCFTGSADEAKRALDFGWYVSFSGILTFGGSDELRRTAAGLPADRILVETDAPYLSPEPVRNRRPNEPAHVVHITARLAEIRRQSVEKLLEQLAENAVRLFGPAMEGVLA